MLLSLLPLMLCPGVMATWGTLTAAQGLTEEQAVKRTAIFPHWKQHSLPKSSSFIIFENK